MTKDLEKIKSQKTADNKRLDSDWDTLFATMPEVDKAFMKERPMNKPPKPKKIF